MSRGHLPVLFPPGSRRRDPVSPAVTRRALHVLVSTFARGFGINSDGRDPTPWSHRCGSTGR